MENKYSSLKNKSFLITGVTSGIGKEICGNLIKQGAKVVGIGRDASKIEALLYEENCSFKLFDLTNSEQFYNF